MLKDTLLKFFKLDGLINHLSEYIETRIELVKLELKEDIAHAISKIAVAIILGALLTLFILFISVSVAYVLADHVGVYGGFAIVAGFYFLLMTMLALFKEPITRKLEQEIKKTFKRKKHEDNGDR
jgi:uncharacterized membrane protein YqjE